MSFKIQYPKYCIMQHQIGLDPVVSYFLDGQLRRLIQ